MKDVADEIEDGGRADGQTIPSGHDFARAPIFAHHANEFAQRKIVVIEARGVGHACAPYIKGERINARIKAVGCAVELAVARKVTRLLCGLNANDLPLMLPVAFDQNIAIALSMFAWLRESARLEGRFAGRRTRRGGIGDEGVAVAAGAQVLHDARPRARVEAAVNECCEGFDRRTIGVHQSDSHPGNRPAPPPIPSVGSEGRAAAFPAPAASKAIS